MPINSRTKGHSFERLVSQLLREHGFPQAIRQLEYQINQAQGIDIANTGIFDIQCKAKKQVPNIPEVFKEIKGKGIKTVIFSVTNKGKYAAFELDDALRLIQVYQRIQQENLLHDEPKTVLYLHGNPQKAKHDAFTMDKKGDQEGTEERG